MLPHRWRSHLPKTGKRRGLSSLVSFPIDSLSARVSFTCATPTWCSVSSVVRRTGLPRLTEQRQRPSRGQILHSYIGVETSTNCTHKICRRRVRPTTSRVVLSLKVFLSACREPMRASSKSFNNPIPYNPPRIIPCSFANIAAAFHHSLPKSGSITVALNTLVELRRQ
jgi:hypothetical protein